MATASSKLLLLQDPLLIADSPESIMQEWTDMVGHHYESRHTPEAWCEKLIEALDKKGFIIGLGTSNSFELAKKSLKHNGIWHFFRTAVTGDEHLKGKPFRISIF
jgi:beta-phosphoglucomutase-like phosphatase (HAD superfamily)